MLLDLKLPDYHGKGLLDLLADISRAVPFIIITGQGDERVAVDMMKRGALDYLVKDAEFLEFLPAVVQRSLAQLDRETRLAAAEVERKRLELEVLGISEREQRRVGEELHDGLFQVLTAISVWSEILQRRLIPISACDAEVAASISRHAHEACALARMLARGLSPVDVETNGLCHALNEMAGNTATLMMVECDFQCHEPVLVKDVTKATHRANLTPRPSKFMARLQPGCVRIPPQDGEGW